MIITYYEHLLYCESYEQKTLASVIRIDFETWKNNKTNYIMAVLKTGKTERINVKDIISISGE